MTNVITIKLVSYKLFLNRGTSSTGTKSEHYFLLIEQVSMIHTGGMGHATPATFETPTRDFQDNMSVHSSSSSGSKGQKKTPDEQESLDEFLFKHTSEDNESFEEMIDEAKKKHRIKVTLFEVHSILSFMSNI